MVGDAGRTLTKLGFRRDVRLFLVALTGFFALLIVALLFALESAYGDARAARVREWNTIADRAAAEIDSNDAAAAGGILTAMQARYAIASIRLVPRSQSAAAPPSTAVVTRPTHAGLLVIRFDDSTLAGLRTKLLAVMTISLLATAVGMILLLLYIPKITRPIEQMLDHAAQLETLDPGADEQEYLIETFRKSIDTLKAQKDELRVLHDRQKSRADEFERITAALTRSLTSGLIAIDAEAHVVDVNDAGREILRLPARDAMTPRAIEEALGTTPLARLLRETFERRAALTREELVTETLGGEPVVVGVTTVPLMDEENRFLGMLALFTDLTAIRKLEERVRNLQSLADLGEMSAGIAHEFRNSLSTILGYLRLAQRQNGMEETHAKIRRAEEEATSLGSAIQSLLSFTRPITVDAQPVDLGDLVRDVVGRLEAYTRGVTIVVRGAAVADADRRLLERAVENVIRNAVDAVRESGRPGEINIDITLAPPAITVRDNGVGIDAETAGRLFLPLQSRKPHGLGLGLPLARKIVLLHGGDLRIAGVSGEGTTVTISLPGEDVVATA